MKLVARPMCGPPRLARANVRYRSPQQQHPRRKAQAETITADKSEFIRRVNAAYKRLRDAEERAQDREEPPPAKRQATEAAREEAQLSAPSATFVHTSAPTLAQILAQVRAQQKS